MKLLYASTSLPVSKETDGIIRLAFATICEELHLHKGTVELNLANELEADGSGQTDSLSHDPYEVGLMFDSPRNLIPVLAHEMIHVKDLSNGVYKVDFNDALETVTMSYAGEKINPRLILMANVLGLVQFIAPYERVPYRDMWPLAIKVIERLPPACQDYINADDAIAFYRKEQAAQQELQAGFERTLQLIKDRLGPDHAIENLVAFAASTFSEASP